MIPVLLSLWISLTNWGLMIFELAIIRIILGTRIRLKGRVRHYVGPWCSPIPTEPTED